MRAHPYLLAAVVALLAACSDTTGPNLSTARTGEGSTGQQVTRLPTGGDARFHHGQQVSPK
jgi:hypothetical protein